MLLGGVLLDCVPGILYRGHSLGNLVWTDTSTEIKNTLKLNQIIIIYYCSINGDKPNFTKNDEVIDTSDIPSITHRVENIYKSEKDPRIYRYLELGNGMKVTLIQ